jgi:hypothetical protein
VCPHLAPPCLAGIAIAVGLLVYWDDTAKKRLWNAKIYHLKSRFEELGYPCEFDVRLNPKTWRFESIVKPPVS